MSDLASAHAGEEETRPKRLPLNRNRDFSIFWAGQAFSVIGDAFVLVAVPLLVLEATGSVAMMGLVTAATGLGGLLSGVFTGAIVDRVDRRRLMIWCDIGRFALYGALPFAWRLLGPHVALIYGITIAGAALAMLFGVAYITAVPNLVERDQLTAANGRLHATFAAGFVLGPMLAGLVSGWYGADIAVGLNGLTFAASALSLSRIQLRRASPVRGGGGGASAVGGSARPRGRWAIFDGLVVGMRFLFGDPLFRALTILLGVMAFLTLGVLDLFIFHLKENLGQSDRAVGIVFGIASLGSMASGVLATLLRRRLGFGTRVIGGSLLQGLSMAAIGIAPTVWLIVVFAVVYTFCESVRGIATMSMRQEVTPDHLLGRVTAAFWIMFSVPGPIGAAIITLGAEWAGVRVALVAAAAVAVGASAFALRGPAAVAHPEPAVIERLARIHGDPA